MFQRSIERKLLPFAVFKPVAKVSFTSNVIAFNVLLLIEVNKLFELVFMILLFSLLILFVIVVALSH